jgi:branched-chain amino acid transport system ATP-binding protein
MLEVKGLTTYYDSVRAIDNVNIEVKEREVVSLIGANGAGKTTLLKTISGLIKPRRGNVSLLKNDITRCSADKIVTMGLVQVLEGRQLFGPLTVYQNMRLGAYSRFGKANHGEIEKDEEMVFELFPILQERRKQKAATLSGGEQQMLAIGRALMAKPRILLLDEPSTGLAPIIIETIFEVLKELNTRGMTILLVEQNTALALDFANRAYVMENGRIVLQGDANQLKEDEQVLGAYLAVEK